MKITLDLPASLWQRLYTEAADKAAPPDVLVTAHLSAGMDVDIEGRWVILQGADLLSLEQRLGGGQIPTSADLVKRIERLARIEFGGHEIRLSLAELEELAWRARKNNKTVAQMVQQVWLSLNEQFFSYAQRS